MPQHQSSSQIRPARPRRTATAAAVALAAGVVCCAGPILAVLGGLSVVSLAAAVWIPGLGAITFVALAGVVWVLRRRRRASCATGSSATAAKVDLGMPAAPDIDPHHPTGQQDQEAGSVRSQS